MGRKRKRSRKHKRDLQHEQQILSSPGAMQDPNIVALLTKAMSAPTEKEKLEYYLQLEDHIAKSASHLQDPALADRLSRMRQGANARDASTEAFQADKVGFLVDTITRSEQFRKTGDAAEQEKARAGKMLQDAIATAQSNKSVKKLQLDYDIIHDPTEDVMGVGNWVTTKMPGVEGPGKPSLRPDVVRIMHRSWTITPGVNRDVPAVFARRYEEILRSRDETDRRKAAMGLDELGPEKEAGAMEVEQMKIDREFGVERDQLGVS